METDFTLTLGNMITIAIFIIGAWIAIRNTTDSKFHETFVSLARMEEKVDALSEKVDNQSTVIERLISVEEQQKTLWKRQDELSNRVSNMEHKEGQHV